MLNHIQGRDPIPSGADGVALVLQHMGDVGPQVGVIIHHQNVNGGVGVEGGAVWIGGRDRRFPFAL